MHSSHSQTEPQEIGLAAVQASLTSSTICTSFGIRADAKMFTGISVEEPALSRTGKAYLTANKLGYDTIQFDTTWVARALLDEITPDCTILDIGAGYGGFTRAALGQGATVISNDVDMRHLLWSRAQVARDLAPELLSKLYLNSSRFPDLELEPQSVDFILAHRVLHFLSGNEIENGLQRCHRWLKPGGTIGIVVMAASHTRLRDVFLPQYNSRVEEGSRWPGEGMTVAKYIPEQAYALPPTLHVMDPAQLQTAVRAAGFTIQRCDFVGMKIFGVAADNRDGKEATGLLAIKL